MIPVIAIIDVGKTNKKIFLFDENYAIVYQKTAQFFETEDEDHFPCENLQSLRQSVFSSLREVLKLKDFDVRALNFSAYGASLVFTNASGQPLTPLYNYLKPYPAQISEALYAKYGGEEAFSLQTASPVLGSLNSGLQLLRLKHEQPLVCAKLKYALHLPQYLSSLLTGAWFSDLTSIGCHTALWDFQKGHYHAWVQEERLQEKLAPIGASNEVIKINFGGKGIQVGIGVHDSSAALIPYMLNFKMPFIVISTGTWCISLNPFDESPLLIEELRSDCLCYMTSGGKAVKAARLFSGHHYDEQVQRIATYFMKDVAQYRDVAFDPSLLSHLIRAKDEHLGNPIRSGSAFSERDLSTFRNDLHAYHQLIYDIVQNQIASTRRVLKDDLVKRIFVDGGFSMNAVFMHFLAAGFPTLEVYASSMAQATAAGAALAIHRHWSAKPIPNDIVHLRYYSPTTTGNFP